MEPESIREFLVLLLTAQKLPLLQYFVVYQRRKAFGSSRLNRIEAIATVDAQLAQDCLTPVSLDAAGAAELVNSVLPTYNGSQVI
jgi:hypothetical protein